jgi:hypothetical protein
VVQKVKAGMAARENGMQLLVLLPPLILKAKAEYYILAALHTASSIRSTKSPINEKKDIEKRKETKEKSMI